MDHRYFFTPRISTKALFGAEAVEVDHINFLLLSLSNFAFGFQQALNLFDHCLPLVWVRMRDADDENPRGATSGWLFLAARGGALEIYHLGSVLDAIHTRIGLCPTILPLVDMSALKRAVRLFNNDFGRISRLRKAITHAGDQIKNRQTFEHYYRTREPTGVSYIISQLSDRTLMLTHKGEQFRIEISQTTMDKLAEIVVAASSAFKPLEEKPEPFLPPAEDQTDRQ